MTKKQIIAFDLDDVLVDSTEFWRQEINRRTGLRLEPHHWLEPGEYSGYYTRLWQKHGIEQVFTIEHIDKQMEADQSALPAIDRAHAVLRHLSSRFDFVAVTARNSNQEPESKKWLEQNYPGLFDAVIFANGSKGLALKNKGEICKEIGANWLVDDSPGYCKDALEQGINAVLFGVYGWHIAIPAGLKHCRTWKELGEYFDAG